MLSFLLKKVHRIVVSIRFNTKVMVDRLKLLQRTDTIIIKT